MKPCTPLVPSHAFHFPPGCYIGYDFIHLIHFFWTKTKLFRSYSWCQKSQAKAHILRVWQVQKLPRPIRYLWAKRQKRTSENEHHQFGDEALWRTSITTFPAPFTAMHWEVSQHGKMADIRRQCVMLDSDYKMLPFYAEGFPAFCVSLGENQPSLDWKLHTACLHATGSLGPLQIIKFPKLLQAR